MSNINAVTASSRMAIISPVRQYSTLVERSVTITNTGTPIASGVVITNYTASQGVRLVGNDFRLDFEGLNFAT